MDASPSFWEWIWRGVAVLATLIGALLLYILRGKDQVLTDHSRRLSQIEQDHVTRDEFNNAMSALRREFRDEQRLVIDELRRGMSELRSMIELNGTRVTDRIDKFMSTVLQQRPPE